MSAFDKYVHHYLGLFKIDASACLRRIVLVPTVRVRTHYQLAWHHCPPLVVEKKGVLAQPDTALFFTSPATPEG